MAEDVERPLVDAYRRGEPQRARPRPHRLRLARTIADLAASDDVLRERVVAALGYRHEMSRRRGGGGVSARAASGGGSGSAGMRGCLARTWLIARLAGSIEIARHQKRRLREILALSRRRSRRPWAVCARGPRSSARSSRRLDVDALREAVERSGPRRRLPARRAPIPARLRDLEDAPAVLFVAGGVGPAGVRSPAPTSSRARARWRW